MCTFRKQQPAMSLVVIMLAMASAALGCEYKGHEAHKDKYKYKTHGDHGFHTFDVGYHGKEQFFDVHGSHSPGFYNLEGHKSSKIHPLEYKISSFYPVDYKTSHLYSQDYKAKSFQPLDYKTGSVHPVDYKPSGLYPVDYKTSSLYSVNYKPSEFYLDGHKPSRSYPLNYKISGYKSVGPSGLYSVDYDTDGDSQGRYAPLNYLSPQSGESQTMGLPRYRSEVSIAL
ncbi:adhesive plaque matrix protein-like [Ischnura elegans]|uniref:adhesive plaque matrix protein-like n=1 Tax=Ischnura elegans TaxID=197161 RepID=UPI001ED8B945|nr:adhesive plaque matrix protein-like [Ischnura elegans]